MIGIIGGNGVAATNRLCQLIEERCTRKGAFRDGHHPEMLIWQATKVPSRSMYLEGKGPNWIEDYVEIGRKMKECGCTKLCMCCNTAHYAIEELSEKIGLPFFNLLDLVALKVKEIRCTKIGMMCSDGLRKVGIYEERFARLVPNVTFVYPDREYQDIVTKGICNAKHKIRFTGSSVEPLHPNNLFTSVCSHLINDKNVDCIVGGCTDISNVFAFPFSIYEDIKYIDSLDILAEAIVKSEFTMKF